jgi:hypothetical protein
VHYLWPPAGVAVTGLIVDIFAATVTYAFYRKNAQPRVAVVAA